MNMRYARIAYQLPLGESGLQLGASYADTHYELGRDFAALQARGRAAVPRPGPEKTVGTAVTMASTCPFMYALCAHASIILIDHVRA